MGEQAGVCVFGGGGGGGKKYVIGLLFSNHVWSGQIFKLLYIEELWRNLRYRNFREEDASLLRTKIDYYNVSFIFHCIQNVFQDLSK